MISPQHELESLTTLTPGKNETQVIYTTQNPQTAFLQKLRHGEICWCGTNATISFHFSHHFHDTKLDVHHKVHQYSQKLVATQC